MGKLGEILRELRQDNPREIFTKGKGSKKRLIILALLFSLLLGSFGIGFYLTHLLKPEKLHNKNLSLLQREVRPKEKPVISQNTTDKKASFEKENIPKKEAETKAYAEQKSSLNPIKLPFKGFYSKEVKPKRLIKSEKIEHKKTQEQIETISPQGFSPLKEKELLKNLLLMAEEARIKGNYLSAIKFYEDYLKYREDPDVLNNLGGLYYLIGNYEGALKVFERSLKIKYDPIVKLNFLIVLFKIGKKEEACFKLKETNFPKELEKEVKNLEGFCR